MSDMNISSMFSNISTKIDSLSTDLLNKMDNMNGDNLDPAEMLRMQFQVNSYNTMLETASSVTKALTDEAKQLAQRAG